MSEYSLFTKLCKYAPRDGKRFVENFTTELFVYVWKHLIDNEAPIVKKLFELFEIPYNKNAEITTQTSYLNSEGKCCIPDISIKINDELYFIEVKIDAPIGEDREENQIEKYSKIDNCERVILLSRDYICDIYKEKIVEKLWYEVYGIFSKFGDKDKELLIKEFLNFLEKNGMNKKIEIGENIKHYFKAKDSVSALMKVLKDAWNKSSLKKKFNSCSVYDKDDGVGYTLYMSSGEWCWFGLLPESVYEKSNENEIYFEVSKSTEYLIINSNSKLGTDIYGNTILCTKSIEDISKGDLKEQVDAIKKWLDVEVATNLK